MLDGRELTASTRAHDHQGARAAIAPVLDTGAFHVPATQLDVAGHVQLQALERVARHGEFDDAGAAVCFRHGLVIGRLREEAGTADLPEVHRAIGFDLAHWIDEARDSGRTLLVRRQPALHLRVDAVEADLVRFAGGPALLQLRIGEFVHGEVAAIAGGRLDGGDKQRHALRRAVRFRQQVAGQLGVPVGADRRRCSRWAAWREPWAAAWRAALWHTQRAPQRRRARQEVASCFQCTVAPRGVYNLRLVADSGRPCAPKMLHSIAQTGDRRRSMPAASGGRSVHAIKLQGDIRYVARVSLTRAASREPPNTPRTLDRLTE